MEVETASYINVAPSTSSTTTTKLGLCEVCAANNAKYTCPRCEVKTCCLKCSTIHKLELDCDGQRDRTKYIPLNKFTNLDLSSDYRLLEEVTRNVEVSRKNFGKKREDIPGYLIKLRNAAKTRKITLKFLPYKFVRHRKNTTRLHFKTDIIYWHVEWVFVNANNLKLYDTKVPETEKLSSVFSKHLIEQSDEYLQENLQFYQAAGISGIKFLLKAEQKIGKKFYELDPTLSLKESLENKVIMEYPTIYVALKDHACGYDVIDSDDEENMDVSGKVKSGNEVINKIVNNADAEESRNNSLKNLMFAYADSGEGSLSSDEN